MVATLAQQLYTMMVQTRLTAPISVKQFNQRLSHFSADDLLTTLSDFFCRTTQELKSWRDGCRRQLETMDQEKQTPPPFSRVFYFLSVCLPLQEDTLEKKALKQLYLISYQGCVCLSKAVRTFLYWSCFIRDLLSVLLLLCLFFVLLFSLTPQSAAANGCSCFSQKFPPVQKELFLPTLAAQRGSLHFSIILLLLTTQHLEMSVGVKHYYIWEIFTLGRLS